MLLMASDYVGHEITKFLCENDKGIDVFVYDEVDRGNYNSSMLDFIRKTYPNAEIYANTQFNQPDVLEHIKQRRLPIGCLAWWPYIIDDRIIGLTERGFINTHPAYLPYNRGKHPYFWSIVEGTKFGVTLHYVNTGIDSGPILVQKEIPISWTDTGESLYMRSREEMLALFYQNFDQIISGSVRGHEQDQSTGTFHYGKELDPFCTLSLDKQYSARQLLNILRGRMFNGKGAVKFSAEGEDYIVSIQIDKVPKED